MLLVFLFSVFSVSSVARFFFAIRHRIASSRQMVTGATEGLLQVRPGPLVVAGFILEPRCQQGDHIGTRLRRGLKFAKVSQSRIQFFLENRLLFGSLLRATFLDRCCFYFLGHRRFSPIPTA